jgi:hypothetical protein
MTVPGVPLTISDLFTPAPSGVGGNPNLAPPDGSWMAIELQIATTVGLPTTAWQAGQPERTMLAINAVIQSQSDVIVSLMAQGTFLDFAASGTVTYVALDGTSVTEPVTPDPSDPAVNPNGVPGLLDALGQSSFGVSRLLATFASGELSIVNTTVASVGPFQAGTFHVANTRTQQTYNNQSPLLLPSNIIAGSGGVITGVTPGATTTIVTSAASGVALGDIVYLNGVGGVTSINGQFGRVTFASGTTIIVAIATSGVYTSGGTLYTTTTAAFAADVIGIPSNASPGDVTSLVTTQNGVGCYNPTAWSAANYESNVNYAARCRLKLGALSPNGPNQAYRYFALTAASILASSTPAVTLKNGPIVDAIAFSNPSTGIVTVVVASATPASTTLGAAVTPGCSQLAVAGASGTPIDIQSVSPHGLATGDFATVTGVLGNTNANVTTTITVLSATHFLLDNTATNSAYTGGGTIEGSDLGQVDNLIQGSVVPDGIVGAVTQSALALPITVVATVVVPKAFAALYRSTVNLALTQYLATLPIGGNIPPGGAFGTVPFSAIEGVLIDVGVQVLGGVSYVRQVSSLAVNGSTIDVVYPTNQYQAQLAPPTITVIGV